MKIKYLIFVLILSDFSYSQEWASVGTKWLYTYSSGTEANLPYDFYQYEVVKDTLIDNKIMRKIEYRHFNWETGNTFLFSEFIYKENNQVYFYKWNQHNLLYDFNVNIGDSYTGFTNTSSTLSSVFNCNLKFDSEINGNIYTFMGLQANGDINYGAEILDQVGSMHYFFPSTSEISEPEYDRLRCYITADTLFYYDEFYFDFCDYYKSLYINELKSKELRFYPNPISNQSTVFIPEEFGNFSSIKIRGVNGQSLSKFIIQNRNITINKNDFDSGIYFIEVETNKQKFIGKFVIE